MHPPCSGGAVGNRRSGRSRENKEAEVLFAPNSGVCSENEKQETLALTRPSPPGEGEASRVLGNFHALWRGTAWWELTLAATILEHNPRVLVCQKIVAACKIVPAS
jgi:hypothetical protein